MLSLISYLLVSCFMFHLLSAFWLENHCPPPPPELLSSEASGSNQTEIHTKFKIRVATRAIKMRSIAVGSCCGYDLLYVDFLISLMIY
jgi:hypothetical protein